MLAVATAVTPGSARNCSCSVFANAIEQLTAIPPAAEPVPVPGDGRQRVAPVWVGDVATAIAAADDAVVGGSTGVDDRDRGVRAAATPLARG